MIASPPTQADLERLYHELARVGAVAVGRKRPWEHSPQSVEALLALAAEMMRYDPRLLSILVQFVLARWRDLNPVVLRAAMKKAEPQALLVVLELAREADPDAELRYFTDYLSAGFKPLMPPRTLFIDAERPGSRMAARRDGRNLRAYARWGYVGTERPTIDAHSKATVGRYDIATRRWVRRKLAERVGEFRLSEYLDALEHGISRGQAQADLQGDPEFIVRGRGRGARWHLKP